MFHGVHGNFFKLNLNPGTIQLPRRRRCYGTEPQSHITQGQLAQALRVQVRGEQKAMGPRKLREKLSGRGVREGGGDLTKYIDEKGSPYHYFWQSPLFFSEKILICRKVAQNIQRTPKNILITQIHQWLTFCIFILSLSFSPPPLSIIAFPDYLRQVADMMSLYP